MDEAAPRWRIGQTVPWVVPWTGEMEFSLAPSTSFPGRTEVVQISRPGVGEPVMGAMHVGRQRLGVTEHLCHVCGRPTTRDDRWLFPVVSGTFFQVPGASEPQYASHLPAIHGACARLAQGACPHLTLTGARPAPFPRGASEILCETSVPEGMAAFAERLPAGQKVVFSYFRLFDRDFSRMVAKLRGEAGVAD
jgi:hypothetical protein